MRPAVPAEGRDWLLAALCAPLGARLAAHDRRNACGWLLLTVGALGAVTVAASLAAAGPAVWLRGWSWWPGYGLLVLVAALFPHGRPASRRWRPLIAGLAVTVSAGTIALASLVIRTPDVLRADHGVSGGWDRPLFLAATAALLLGAVLAASSLVVRLRRGPSRGLLRWTAANAALLAVALILDTVGSVPAAWLAGVLAIPVATVIGVVRYGLYDITLLVHRALLHGILTVTVLALYVGAVTVTARFLPAAATPIAVTVCVLALLPLRQHLQSLLTRRLYGHDPYELVTTLGRSADLSSVAADMARGLRVPYVAVVAAGTEAAYGHRRHWPVTEMPLGDHGLLIVQQRAPDEPWSRRELALLRDLAAQLRPLAASVRLTRDMRTAAARARAEEARRLQRDLHDGVGPALFGARMLVRAGRAHTASAHVSPPNAGPLEAGPVEAGPAHVRPGQTRAGADLRRTWDELEAGLADAGAEIRRILTGLGPAALDRGLPAALETVAHRHRGSGLRVTLDVPDDLGGLPAAVEVAAYRIVDEALTNVARHARAATAAVTVTRDAVTRDAVTRDAVTRDAVTRDAVTRDAVLRVTVADDGVGGAAIRPGGLGLGSVRDRCVELGGELTVSGSPGTVLTATLPLL